VYFARITNAQVTVRLLYLLALPVSMGAQTIATIRVTPASPVVVAGETIRLRAEPVDGRGRRVGNTSVSFQQAGARYRGRVDASGRVIGAAPGTIPVVVTAVPRRGTAVQLTVNVSVVPGPAASITLRPTPARIAIGQSIHATATVRSALGDARRDSIAWATSDTTVATVATNGLVTARAEGRVTLTARTGTVAASHTFEVTGGHISTVFLQPSSPVVQAGDVVRFALTARDTTGAAIEGLAPTWLLAPGRGELGSDGAFVGYEPGSYTVSAMLGAHTMYTTVTVIPRDARQPVSLVGSAVRSAFPSSAISVHPNGRVAYLGTHLGGGRIYVIDIVDPAHPRITDSVLVNAGVVSDITVDEAGTVLVASRRAAPNGMNGIVVATLENPLRPRLTADYTSGIEGGVHAAFVQADSARGTHVYVTSEGDGGGAIHVIDITRPGAPREIARWQTQRPAPGRVLRGLEVRDGLLYTGSWSDGLVILDVGNGVEGGSPSRPRFVSQYTYDFSTLYNDIAEIGGPSFLRGARSAERHGDYVFVADEVFTTAGYTALISGKRAWAYGRLHVLDVSNIHAPREVAFYEPERGGVREIRADGDALYIAGYDGGLRVLDISGELRGDLGAQHREIAALDPVSPNGFLPNLPMTWDLVVRDGLVYVSDFNSGLHVVRVEGQPR
jgi:hypothetical protein